MNDTMADFRAALGAANAAGVAVGQAQALPQGFFIGVGVMVLIGAALFALSKSPTPAPAVAIQPPMYPPAYPSVIDSRNWQSVVLP